MFLTKSKKLKLKVCLESNQTTKRLAKFKICSSAVHMVVQVQFLVRKKLVCVNIANKLLLSSTCSLDYILGELKNWELCQLFTKKSNLSITKRRTLRVTFTRPHRSKNIHGRCVHFLSISIAGCFHFYCFFNGQPTLPNIDIPGVY